MAEYFKSKSMVTYKEFQPGMSQLAPKGPIVVSFLRSEEQDEIPPKTRLILESLFRLTDINMHYSSFDSYFFPFSSEGKIVSTIWKKRKREKMKEWSL